MVENVFDSDAEKFTRKYDAGDIDVWLDGGFVCIQSHSMDKPLKISLVWLTTKKHDAIEKETGYFL